MFPGGLTGRDVAERMLHDNGHLRREGRLDARPSDRPLQSGHENGQPERVGLREQQRSRGGRSGSRVRACGTARQGIRPAETPLGARAGRQLLVSMGRMGRNSRNPDDEDVSRAVLGRYRNDRRLGPCSAS